MVKNKEPCALTTFFLLKKKKKKLRRTENGLRQKLAPEFPAL